MKQHDQRLSADVYTRSMVGGYAYCEVPDMFGDHVGPRCPRFLDDVHHLKGGNGQRGRGESADPKFKLGVCRDHHTAIHKKKLIVTGEYGAFVFKVR